MRIKEELWDKPILTHRRAQFFIFYFSHDRGFRCHIIECLDESQAPRLPLKWRAYGRDRKGERSNFGITDGGVPGTLSERRENDEKFYLRMRPTAIF